ncbi:MAG TPA: NAD(P)H-hydrate dehydratase, partial [Clostridia bacterium]|nr:NAD(P)H-hydrate dehydratase [Clostridia bacterium]
RWDMLSPLFEADISQVWDADGLNLLARFGGKPPRGAVLTPHPGEAARMLGWPVERIVNDPREAGRALADRTEATVLLKGATTLIVQGEKGSLNISGCAGLATGGSGDVLSGLIGALLAQGLSAYDAACLGAFLHGRAGERAASDLSERGMTAWDLPERLMPSPAFEEDEPF